MMSDELLERLHEALARRDSAAALRCAAGLGDLEVCDDFGMRPLHFAARFADPEVARALLQRGAKVNAETVLGSTPLSMALNPLDGAQVSEPLVRALLAAGARGELPSSLAHLLATPPAPPPAPRAALRSAPQPAPQRAPQPSPQP
ncbi:MAG: hypothetical protein FJ138_16810, partial [Deltaproteobacteria bacterium]|nr:hypothetical protein [Deltaproteobacteria bacterium]